MDRAFVDEIISKMDKGDVVLATNEINEVPYILQKAHTAGMKVVFNPSPITDDLMAYPLEYVDTLILNEVEGNGLTGEMDADAILNALWKAYPDTKVLLTLGAAGSIYRSLQDTVRQEAIETKVIDTTAAGDAFTGYFLACRAAGRSLGESMRIASMAASITVSRKGASTSIPYLPEVLKALTEYRK
jgi:ribokinase